MSDTKKVSLDRLAESLKAADTVAGGITKDAVQDALKVIPEVSAKPQPTLVPLYGDELADLFSNNIPQAEKQAVFIEDALTIKPPFNFAILGTGQAGGRLADTFYRMGYRRVGAFNLTESDFSGLSEEFPKYSLEVGGAAKDAAYASSQLKQHEDEVWDLMTRAWGVDIDYALITVGLGGGSGSGTAPRLVELARQYMESQGRPPRVGAVVSLPSANEGQQVCRNAVTSFRKLLELKVAPLIVVDNSKIHQIYRPGISKLFPLANRLVVQNFTAVLRMCEQKAAMYQFDKSELAHILDAGVTVMGAAEIQDIGDIKSPADISTAIRDKLTNNMLAEIDLRSGTRAACLFAGNSNALEVLSEDYFVAGFDYLNRLVKGGVQHRGVFTDEKAAGLRMFAIIGGLAPPVKRLTELAKQAGLDANNVKMSLAAFLGVDDSEVKK